MHPKLRQRQLQNEQRRMSFTLIGEAILGVGPGQHLPQVNASPRLRRTVREQEGPEINVDQRTQDVQTLVDSVSEDRLGKIKRTRHPVILISKARKEKRGRRLSTGNPRQSVFRIGAI